MAIAVGAAAPALAADADPVIMTVGITQDVDSLNPFTGIVAEAYEMYGLIYDSLTGYSQEDFSPVPGLAESWEPSEDGLTWTYAIREGVTFSDGEPLTSADVVYTFRRIIDGTYEQTNWGNYVANVTDVEAPDDQTVVMTVAVPTPIMQAMPVPILPEHVWDAIDGSAVADYSNEPDEEGGSVGSGPFRLIEHSANQFLRFEANPDHWSGAPNIDGLTFRIFTNQDSMAQALRRGEIDVADALEANVFNSLQDVEGIETVAAAYSGFDELAMNVGAALDDGTPIGDGHPALADVEVRRAIAHAVDTETLVERALGGYGTPGTTVIPSLYDRLHLAPAAPYEFDLDEANRILDDAGYELGADGVRMMPDGSQPLNFRIFARQESPSGQTSVEFIAGWLTEIGMQIEIEVVSEDSLTEIIGNGEFDMFEWGWVVEPDPDYQLSTFTCASRSYVEDGITYANLSDSFYCNPDYDELYALQATQIDLAERAETVREMQQILYDDVPYVVTYYYDNLEAYRSDRFAGFQPQPAPNGSLLFQYGSYSYRNVEAVSGDDDAVDAGGGGSAVTIAVVAGAMFRYEYTPYWNKMAPPGSG
ncbi:MAG: ABC transporter substrate-binding protein [Geodermatophilaceae bacterium]|nr:ABC transporter substrate-binding protein [Geodermatophilaceae bacterium]